MSFLQERYRLLKLISQGEFVKTFLAVDEGLFPAVRCVVQEFSLQKEIFVDLQRRVQVLEEIGKHPQIPTIKAYFQEEGQFYLVREFIEGSNLASVLSDEGVFGESQIWQLLEDLLPVLKYISDRHIIHRNIQPENIIRRKTGDFVLVNFATAKFGSNFEDFTDECSIGSPEYAAPEQVKGKSVFASDLYSLGVICIYLLTQIPTFDLFDVANNCWAWRDYLTTKVSDFLAKILDKLLENSVNRRFQDADEVMEVMGIKSQNLKSQIQNPPWQCLHTLTGNGVLSNVNSIAISPDGNILVSGNDDKSIVFWDLNRKEAIANIKGHSQAVKSVALGTDGKLLATASDDKTIKIWDVNTCQEILTLVGHSRPVKSVAFSHDGKLLASGSWDKTVKIWDVYSGKEICTLTGHKLQVSAVAFSPQSKLLASASFDRTINLWNCKANESPNQLKNRPHQTLIGHTGAVLTVAFSPDGQILATGSDDNTIKLWEVNTGKLIHTLSSHSWSVVTLAFSADGETLISGSWDKTIKLSGVNTTAEIATLSGHVDSVFALAVSPVAQLIASGSRDKTIKLWQLVESQ
ncbi:serine/threonine protein kinase [Plectonema radiosum NIES-515]|uniref:Serine/threonine protein kinase n=1 Tax=Plectonema radiosum NIES-515 TaxID=2986073 RepID=A0ABT3B5P1_9CYAN|nr:serine/threonine-protein kinase [Plectonema radiosum]MCV3216695.1 serine/threonine protein kinase [Plectonema radiosum NIES-515]